MRQLLRSRRIRCNLNGNRSNASVSPACETTEARVRSGLPPSDACRAYALADDSPRCSPSSPARLRASPASRSPLRLDIRGLKPTLRDAAERLDALRTPEGAPLPPNKLLVAGKAWRHRALGQRFYQGYLARGAGVTVSPAGWTLRLAHHQG